MFSLGIGIEEVFVYALIFSFSKSGEYCPNDRRLICKNTNLTSHEVKNSIKRMLKKGMIVAVKGDDGETVEGYKYSSGYLEKHNIKI